jgi:hypothetical protein
LRIFASRTCATMPHQMNRPGHRKAQDRYPATILGRRWCAFGLRAALCRPIGASGKGLGQRALTRGCQFANMAKTTTTNVNRSISVRHDNGAYWSRPSAARSPDRKN